MPWFEVDIEQIDKFKIRLEAETIDEATTIASIVDLSEGVPLRHRNVSARALKEDELESDGNV